MGRLTRCLDSKLLVIQVKIFASFYEFLIRRFKSEGRSECVKTTYKIKFVFYGLLYLHTVVVIRLTSDLSGKLGIISYLFVTLWTLMT